MLIAFLFGKSLSGRHQDIDENIVNSLLVKPY